MPKLYDCLLTHTSKSLGDLPEPYYWWEAGLMWGAMLDYYHYTGDATYNDNIVSALVSPLQTGPNFDYVPPGHAHEEGNDDLGFWGFAVMAAAEMNFPQPHSTVPAWLDLGKNIFQSLVSRWNDDCGGGLIWQIYANNPNGMTYKNSVSNGGFFQLAARLYRATGEKEYLDWASRIYDWTTSVGLIDDNFYVYDGVDTRDGCSNVNKVAFTYSHGIFMYGAAVLADATGSDTWHDRAEGLVRGVHRFFTPPGTSSSIMYEAACDTVNTCTTDMLVHKATLARMMWKTAAMMPSLSDAVHKFLDTTVQAAVATCTGGPDGKQCGQRWYKTGNDGSLGLGQQLCALELVHGLLAHEADLPLKGDAIEVVRTKAWAMATASTSTVVA